MPQDKQSKPTKKERKKYMDTRLLERRHTLACNMMTRLDAASASSATWPTPLKHATMTMKARHVSNDSMVDPSTQVAVGRVCVARPNGHIALSSQALLMVPLDGRLALHFHTTLLHMLHTPALPSTQTAAQPAVAMCGCCLELEYMGFKPKKRWTFQKHGRLREGSIRCLLLLSLPGFGFGERVSTSSRRPFLPPLHLGHSFALSSSSSSALALALALALL
jgi:hypothetical protein